MLKKLFVIMIVALLSFGVLFADTTDTASGITEDEMPETLVEKFSYALGVLCAYNFGADYAMDYFYYYQYYTFPEADEYFAFMGVYDAYYDQLIFSFEELDEFLNTYSAEYEARVLAIAEENLKTAEVFLAANASRNGVVTTESGLQYKIISQGDGPRATGTDSVELDYELKLIDGTILDSSYERGEHETFPMDSVIEGFREGVMLMPMGSHYIFYIHPSLGYGETMTSHMEPNSLLIFNVETYSIVDSTEV
jgi:FKBP-type peptidyl-prolyl cis-trans isomerase